MGMFRFRVCVSTLMLMVVANFFSAFAAVSTHVAWTTSAEMVSDNEGVIRWNAAIDKGWHIYGLTMPRLDNTITPPPTSFTIDSGAGLRLLGDGKPDRPAEVKVDEVMNLKLGQWDGNVSFIQRFRLAENISGAEIRGVIRFQACSSTACTPPNKEPFDVNVGTAVSKPYASEEPVVPERIKRHEPVVMPNYDSSTWWEPVDVPTEGQQVPSTDGSAWWSLLLWGFLGGLAALLTPCVWPMIPMTMSFFLKKTSSRRKSMAD
ncbi:MAG: protein-disulfide reductase DsbD N-terminal domain-containing protein, partial [Muribaculaceae bacterium]|nr:protein-disulfide reductase DsbD N-terminal domain-containing protein [Muribaculaceae bacterium]